MTIKKIIVAAVCSVPVIIGLVLGQADKHTSANGNPLRFSKAAMEVMGNAEGCRRDPYLCPARIITQGIGHTGKGVTAVNQLARASTNTQQALNTAQVGQQNQMARYGVAQNQAEGDNSLGLRSALATAGAKNGIREGEQDRQMNILTGGSASLRQQMNIGGGSNGGNS